MNYGSEVMVSKTSEKMSKNKITQMTEESDFISFSTPYKNSVILQYLRLLAKWF